MKPILILDSDPSFTQLIVQRLRLEGYAATSANTISEAQALLNKIQPLLICSDLILSDGYGFDLLGYAQEVMPTVPFIIMSGHNQKWTAPINFFQPLLHYEILYSYGFL